MASWTHCARAVLSASRSEALRAELESLREAGAARADIELLRGELETLRGGDERVEALGVALESLRDGGAAREDVELLRGELEALRAGGEQVDALRAELEALRAGGEQVDALRAELEALRAGGERLDALGVALDSLRESGAAREDVELLRGELESCAPQRPGASRSTIAPVDGLNRGSKPPRAGRGGAAEAGPRRGARPRGQDGRRPLRRRGPAAGRADQDELRAAVARLGGELVVAREQLDQAAEEAFGARERAAAPAKPRRRARRRRARASTPRSSGASNPPGERLESTAADVARVERELNAFREQAAGTAEDARRAQADTLQGGVERIAEQVAAGRVESEARAAELLVELAAVRRLAEQAGSGVTELRAELSAVRTLAELADAVAEKSRLAVEEQLLVAKGDAGQDPGEQAAQVFREMLGLAARAVPTCSRSRLRRRRPSRAPHVPDSTTTLPRWP